jgi:hypothetical protein
VRVKFIIDTSTTWTLVNEPDYLDQTHHTNECVRGGTEKSAAQVSDAGEMIVLIGKTHKITMENVQYLEDQYQGNEETRIMRKDRIWDTEHKMWEER